MFELSETIFLLVLQKEADRAAEDAAEIKKRFLAVQGQANDAQHVAMETKREAERLREEAEKAELDMAAAASVRAEQQRQEEEAQKQAQAQAPAPPSTNGYPGYGQPAAPPTGYGYQQQQPMGYGQPPMGQAPMGQPPMSQQPYQYNSMAPAPMATPQPVEGGFGAGVMGGGGGFNLPSPTEMTQTAGDMYTNPFAS